MTPLQTTYDYIAYIDESGDDGLRAVKPCTFPGSSEWLILSAVVIRASNESKVAGWVRDIRAGFRSRQAKALHFADLSPANKAQVCQFIAGLDLRCFVVASNKKNMEGYKNPDAEKIPSQCWFYCWMTRVLLERVTRFVLQRSLTDHGEPRRLRIEYSARGGLRYDQMHAYYEWLRMKRHKPFLPWGKLCFEVMDVNLLRVYPHHEREGLQLADTVAAAFFKACDKHDTGACDPSFAKLLQDRMAREPDNQGGKISGFGVKLLPSFARARLDNDQAEIFKHYGYPSQWWDPAAFSDDR
ncbi:DUF3800 domain-containing protein [Bradyrhizobium sp. 2TAF36]|uniref:DUF3800 domain-containing protein n=1 Tax=Bradyrhizobium sp. 2TAF36 TaxID=3233016 RepID=UPI003F936A5C